MFTKLKVLSYQFSLTCIFEYMFHARQSARHGEYTNWTIPTLKNLDSSERDGFVNT